MAIKQRRSKSVEERGTRYKAGLRWYRGPVDSSEWLLSVTSLRSAAGLSMPLHMWILKQWQEAAWTTPRGNLTADPDGKAWRGKVTEKADELRDSAASLGSLIHHLADQSAAVESLTDDLVDEERKRFKVPETAPDPRPYLRQLQAARDDLGWNVRLASELRVAAPASGYAGTLDGLYRDKNGSIILTDLKTGRGLYPDQALQVLLYAFADIAFTWDEEANEPRIDRTATGWLGQIEKATILHLQPDSWRLVDIPFKDGSEVAQELADAARALAHFGSWIASKGKDLDTAIGGAADD